jgi:hypothetical protein
MKANCQYMLEINLYLKTGRNMDRPKEADFSKLVTKECPFLPSSS